MKVNVNAPVHTATAIEKINVETIKTDTRAAELIALLFFSHFLNLVVTLLSQNLLCTQISGVSKNNIVSNMTHY